MKKFYLIPESQGEDHLPHHFPCQVAVQSTSLILSPLFSKPVKLWVKFSCSSKDVPSSSTSMFPSALFPFSGCIQGLSHPFKTLVPSTAHRTWGEATPCLGPDPVFWPAGDTVCGACWDGACPPGCLGTRCSLTLSLVPTNSPNPFHLCFFSQVKTYFLDSLYPYVWKFSYGIFNRFHEEMEVFISF